MNRRSLLVPIALLAGLPGCSLGSNDASPSSDDSDKRAVALACIQDKGVDARLEGEHSIVVGGGKDAPHIKFYLTSGQSEAAIFEGHGEGAEQIGQALLFVGSGSDDLLQPVEKCLADL